MYCRIRIVSVVVVVIIIIIIIIIIIVIIVVIIIIIISITDHTILLACLHISYERVQITQERPQALARVQHRLPWHSGSRSSCSSSGGGSGRRRCCWCVCSCVRRWQRHHVGGMPRHKDLRR
jgi:hypothetical protein